MKQKHEIQGRINLLTSSFTH